MQELFDVCQLTIRTVKEDYFVGCDKVDKHAYLFSYSDLGEIVFHDRKQALDKVLVAENNKKKINNEVFTRSIEMYVFIGFMVGFFIGAFSSLFAISMCVASDERENFYTDTDDDK